MKALALLLAIAAASCCSNQRDPDKPGVLDKAADVGKGVLCGSDEPLAFLPWSDSDAFRTGWQVARALLCQPTDPEKPSPAIAADVEATPNP